MAVDEAEISEIRRRWTAAERILQGWAALPWARRERVLAELEESSRQALDDDDQFASDITAALDALDMIAEVGSLDLVAHATNDIRVVLSALDEISKKP
ncbi:hypothetical protein WME99_46345 [Sorangium sp. So ce136]|uniref:hypothetical protein n=1 Tax=Sorangium sp. So ce136 TaxID=3133284 RepID=UPI003F0327D6